MLLFLCQSWTNIQSLMKKAGKESLKRQILNIDPRKIDIRQTQEAQNLIKPFTIESIQEISIGLALFFVFVSIYFTNKNNSALYFRNFQLYDFAICHLLETILLK